MPNAPLGLTAQCVDNLVASSSYVIVLLLVRRSLCCSLFVGLCPFGLCRYPKILGCGLVVFEPCFIVYRLGERAHGMEFALKYGYVVDGAAQEAFIFGVCFFAAHVAQCLAVLLCHGCVGPSGLVSYG